MGRCMTGGDKRSRRCHKGTVLIYIPSSAKGMMIIDESSLMCVSFLESAERCKIALVYGASKVHNNS